MQIAPLGLVMPDLYERIFNPDYIPPDLADADPAKVGLWTPTTDEEFAEMAAEWEDLGDLDLSGIFETPDLGLP